MTCEGYYEWISARLDGELTETEERELESHLEQCPFCRGLANQLAGLQENFFDLEEIPAPDGFTRGVMERISSQQKVIPLFKRPQFKAVAGLAACLALCVGLYGTGQLNWGASSGQTSGVSTISSGTSEAEEGGTGGTPKLSAAAAGEDELPQTSADELPESSIPKNNETAQNEVTPRINTAVYGVAAPQNLDSTENSAQEEPAEVQTQQPVLETEQPQPEENGGQVDATGGENSIRDIQGCSFQNDQYIPISAGAEQQESAAVILGSTQSLTEYIAAFPEDDLSAAVAPYDEAFFQTGRLLAVVLESEGEAVQYRLQAQGLTEDGVTVSCQQTDEQTADVWLILAEVGKEFSDGDKLELSVVQE